MLPKEARMRARADYDATLGRSRSSAPRAAGRGSVVVHLAEGFVDSSPTARSTVRVGFIVSKAVGNAVVRHRVNRQLRHILRDRLERLPAGARVVVRARPSAARKDSHALALDVDAALAGVGLRG